MTELRWYECDSLPEWADRIECRTSKLNDGFHELQSAVQELRHHQADIERKLDSFQIVKWTSLAGLAATVVKIVADLAGLLHIF